MPVSEENSLQELNESILGTMEYWNEIYEKEIENYKDFHDKGAKKQSVSSWVTTGSKKP